MEKIRSNTTQEMRVLEALQKADGGWINGQYFLRTMFLSQYHRAIWNLQKRRERYGYEGIIEASDFKDEYGFKSYRLVRPQHQMALM
jgi:hypothetical protein